MLPYWQENLRVQILQSYKTKYKGTTEGLSQCWANKWFMGCTYPRGVHDIIDQWPAPRKEDVDDSVSVPRYERILQLASKTNSKAQQPDTTNDADKNTNDPHNPVSSNEQNAHTTLIQNDRTHDTIQSDLSNTHTHIGEKRNSDTMRHIHESTDDFNPRKKRRINSATGTSADYDTSTAIPAPLPPPASITANTAQCIIGETDKHKTHSQSKSKKRPRWG
mmetsp:Transcript_20886/g.33433  ORF Transcript_20886/g.33433 Transcript_20886/m.33433 type:complete len:220 (-) Transcript_20886:40-699(-)|eukprot:CAMPEP_0202713926 /NCGR_PEP_ID=MMETSP1385-20130828/61542_1 /ASSEMBLY_ACC=CAM_ASM_000861 /TAXON_ID=933848 /ORGANISM="Elphidium margaritaceum" /LENGTH=219 /DNA_ID=CAMNT_0049374473 /DNA_START=44 /DNA_END=703 /DNA_ORIENTATION=+